MTDTEKRAPGRPPLKPGEHKQRMHLNLSPEVVEHLQAMPRGKRAGRVDAILREGLGLPSGAKVEDDR